MKKPWKAGHEGEMSMIRKASFRGAATLLAVALLTMDVSAGLAASRKTTPPPPQNTVTNIVAYGGAFGRYFVPDGSQQRLNRTVAGAAPNIIATGAGIRCEYRYVVQNGQRLRFQYCN
jgi:hypothetical protein